MRAKWLRLRPQGLVAASLAGDLVALRFSQVVRRSFRTYRKTDVFIVPVASQSLYQELTGDRVALSFSPKSEDRPRAQPAGPRECQNPQPLLRSPELPIVGCPGCGQPTLAATYDPLTQTFTAAPPLCHACRGQLD